MAMRRFFTLLALPPASAKLSETDAAPGFRGCGKAFLNLLLVICLLSPLAISAEEGIEHPFIEPKQIKPETCLTCHPEKKEGQFVHAAGDCENCHRIISEKNQTTITLFATGGDLCAKCHEVSKAPVLHGPYKAGQCLICHEPHSSAFKAHTRSSGNALCLECHAPKRVTGDTVTLFSRQRISMADFEAIPKIELDPTLRFGHPCAAHPVAEVPDPLHQGEKMSCLSCHDPHGSNLANTLVLAKEAGDLCDTCHRAIPKTKQPKLENQPQPERTPNLPTQLKLKGRGDCRNSFGGD